MTTVSLSNPTNSLVNDSKLVTSQEAHSKRKIPIFTPASNDSVEKTKTKKRKIEKIEPDNMLEKLPNNVASEPVKLAPINRADLQDERDTWGRTIEETRPLRLASKNLEKNSLIHKNFIIKLKEKYQNPPGNLLVSDQKTDARQKFISEIEDNLDSIAEAVEEDLKKEEKNLSEADLEKTIDLLVLWIDRECSKTLETLLEDLGLN